MQDEYQVGHLQAARMDHAFKLRAHMSLAWHPVELRRATASLRTTRGVIRHSSCLRLRGNLL
eukprot:3195136-Pyramimonas_sp.AAC.1